VRGRWSDSHDLLAVVLAIALAMFSVWMLLLLAVSGGGVGDGTAPAVSQPTTTAVSPATWLLLLGP
jgi:hypothetical protein